MKPHTLAEKMGLWGSDDEIEHYRRAGWDVPDFTDVERRSEQERIRQEILENIENLKHVPGSESTIKQAMDSYYKVWPQEPGKRKFFASPGLNEFSALDLMVDRFEGW